jgi:cytoskeletal protein RodZ
MASLSERLKRERELRGISLRQISEETRIGVRFLEALEEGKLEVIPGEFYRRSYLRAYARYLGLDEDRAVNVYDYTRKEKAAAEDQAQPGASLPPWLKWVVAAAGLAIPTLLLLRAMPAATPEAPPTLSPEASAPATPEPVPESAPAPVRETPLEELVPFPSGTGPMVTIAQEKTDLLRLVISLDESCWLEVAADGEVVASGLKEAGYQKEVVARQEVRLWLGNAGGVKLVLNDQPVKPLGRPGQVRKDLTITRENLGEFVVVRDGRS